MTSIDELLKYPERIGNYIRGVKAEVRRMQAHLDGMGEFYKRTGKQPSQFYQDMEVHAAALRMLADRYLRATTGELTGCEPLEVVFARIEEGGNTHGKETQGRG